jgi:hypothetical protein
MVRIRNDARDGIDAAHGFHQLQSRLSGAPGAGAEVCRPARTDDVDASIEQYVDAPAGRMADLGRRGIRKADFVLIVCADIHVRRRECREAPEGGGGVLWEGKLIYLKRHVVSTERRSMMDAPAENRQVVPQSEQLDETKRKSLSRPFS